LQGIQRPKEVVDDQATRTHDRRFEAPELLRKHNHQLHASCRWLRAFLSPFTGSVGSGREIRKYRLYAIQDKKISAATYQGYRAALKFFFTKTLKQPWFEQEVPKPKVRRKLPEILSPEEIAKLLNSTMNLKHRAMLATLYGAGLRRAELRTLKVSDVDSKRMVIHIRAGKGQLPRQIPLSPKLLEVLRVYWRWRKPTDWLFPSARYPQRPIDVSGIFGIVEDAAKRAGLKRRVTPHLLRNASA
jgi:integrase/recombinase XerD